MGVRAHLIGDVHRDLIVEAWRRAKARGSIVGPEDADLRLLGGARCRRDDSIAAHRLYFVKRDRVFGAVQCRWDRSSKLGGGLQDEWFHLPPIGAQREWMMTDWILSPFPRLIAGDEIRADARFHIAGAVVCAQRQDRRGSLVPESDAIALGTAVRHLAKFVCKLSIKGRLLRREQRTQSIVCRLANGAVHRSSRIRWANSGIAFVATGNCI